MSSWKDRLTQPLKDDGIRYKIVREENNKEKKASPSPPPLSNKGPAQRTSVSAQKEPVSKGRGVAPASDKVVETMAADTTAASEAETATTVPPPGTTITTTTTIKTVTVTTTTAPLLPAPKTEDVVTKETVVVASPVHTPQPQPQPQPQPKKSSIIDRVAEPEVKKSSSATPEVRKRSATMPEVVAVKQPDLKPESSTSSQNRKYVNSAYLADVRRISNKFDSDIHPPSGNPTPINGTTVRSDAKRKGSAKSSSPCSQGTEKRVSTKTANPLDAASRSAPKNNVNLKAPAPAPEAAPNPLIKGSPKKSVDAAVQTVDDDPAPLKAYEEEPSVIKATENAPENADEDNSEKGEEEKPHNVIVPRITTDLWSSVQKERPTGRIGRVKKQTDSPPPGGEADESGEAEAEAKDEEVEAAADPDIVQSLE